jgi:hypothetical protein
VAAKHKSERELVSILTNLRRASVGQQGSELSHDREAALHYFHGRPYGKLAAPEDPNRSSYVSRDLMETVLWAMPSLLRVFISGTPVEFTPVTQADEEAAKQETDSVVHVVMKDNPGFMVFFQWFWDALISKNGYVHLSWDERSRTEIQTYSNVSEEELTQIIVENKLRGGEAEIVEIEEAEQDEQELALLGPSYKHVKLRVRWTMDGRCVMDNIPPEDVRVSQSAKFSLKEASYCGYRSVKTRSELLEYGFSKSIVEDLPAFRETNYELEGIARNTIEDEQSRDERADPSMDEIEVWTEYVRCDYDNDGIAELRRVISAGDQVLDNEEVDTIHLYNASALLLPHQHIGMSMYDILKDLQEIRTVLSRQLLDNIYNTAIDSLVVSEDRMVDPQEWLYRQPGGIYRVRGDVQSAVMQAPTGSVSHHILPVIDYWDQRREMRTGIGRATQGLDADTLKKSTAAAYSAATDKSSELLEMMARVLAETAVAPLFKGVHELLMKHQNKARIIQLRKGEYVDINPLEWKFREDLNINVGIGNNRRDEELEKLLLIGQLQEKAMGIIALPDNAYNLAEDIVEKAGLQKRGRYFTPADQMPPPPEPDPINDNPLVAPEMIKQQARQAADEMKYQQQMQQLMFKEMIKDEQFMKNLAFQMAKLEVENNRDLFKEGIGAELKAYDIASRNTGRGSA